MPDFIPCPFCAGEGWITHDSHCSECDGTGEVEEDPFYIGADRLYDEMKDNQLTENGG